MYDLVEGLINLPSGYNANSTITYLACALVMVFTVILIDMVFRLIKSCFGRSQL